MFDELPPERPPMNTPALLTKSHNGMAFTFREDGWFNMTKAAKHFGKRLDHFMASPDTKEYIEEVSKVLSPKSGDKSPITVQRGNGNLPSVGTWAHPKLAVFFARWLDVRFSVWCDAVIEDILKGAAEVTITKPQASKFCRTFSRPASMRFPGLNPPVPRVGPHPLRL